MVKPRRGEIWQYRIGMPDNRRPIVILTRQEVLLPAAHRNRGADTIRGLPSEVIVGAHEGLKRDSAISLDHVQMIEQRFLHRLVGTLSETKKRQVWRALCLATGCA